MSEATLADLHARARRLGVPGFRLLPRAELVEAIEAAEGGEAAEQQPEVGEEERPRARRRGRRGGRGRRRGGRPEGDSEASEGEAGREDEELPDEVETVEVTGVLDRMPQGYGFLRLQGLVAGEGDVYVSASQIKRCELRTGDQVSGPARDPRRGERHRALVRVSAVNGQEPESERTAFEELTPVAPHRRVAPQGPDQDPIARAVDLLGPLAFGQRVLILAEPRSGRTTLLRSLARVFGAAGAPVVVLLVDERPEEVTAWQRELPEAEIVAAPADREPRDQARVAELAIGNARRRAAAGEDVVVLIDSISRLALGYRDPGRIKRLFGVGRELSEEGSGSLTVIATVLETDDDGEGVRSALETTENLLLRLDPDLAAAGVVPSLALGDCRSSGEDELRSAEELEAVRSLRAELAGMETEEAARALGERIASTAGNEELLGG